jgi:hypothetical protein
MLDVSMQTLPVAVLEFRPIQVGNLTISAGYKNVIQHQVGFSIIIY